jgi:hypothetical protein
MIQDFRIIPHAFRNCILLFLALTTPGFTAVVNSPSQDAVNAAKSAPLISYNRTYSGGAYTNGAWFGGASVVLAVASHAGNTSADARLLEQIRHLLVGTNAICANGGYPAQHERHATGMFAIVRQTPRIWGQFTSVEKAKIDLLMKAALVASAFTTSNNNPYILARIQQYTLDGDSNLNRDWNPNYREGMIGGMLVGMAYFGGPAAANAILNGYSHADFIAELNANGLSNPYQIFNWKTANPTSLAPTGAMIQAAVANYKYYNSTLTDYMGIYNSLVGDTYGKNVNAGLNGGAGINGAGKIASGAATLPNSGAPGMLKEFESLDGGGPRSSLSYSYDGFRPHLTNQLVLIISGYWPKGTAAAIDAAKRMTIGNTDLWYKLEKGYINYSGGRNQGLSGATFAGDFGFAYVSSLWEDVLQPYHELDSDGDGTGDSTELRLGLDPYNGSSRFAADIQGATLRWPGAAGLTFIVQRSSGNTGIVWENLATVSSVAGTGSYTDPSPPAGKAFYRVGLAP